MSLFCLYFTFVGFGLHYGLRFSFMGFYLLYCMYICIQLQYLSSLYSYFVFYPIKKKKLRPVNLDSRQVYLYFFMPSIIINKGTRPTYNTSSPEGDPTYIPHKENPKGPNNGPNDKRIQTMAHERKKPNGYNAA